MSNKLTVEWCIDNLSSFSNNAEFVAFNKRSVLFLTPVSDETAASVEVGGATPVIQLIGFGERPSVRALCKKLRTLDGERLIGFFWIFAKSIVQILSNIRCAFSRFSGTCSGPRGRCSSR